MQQNIIIKIIFRNTQNLQNYFTMHIYYNIFLNNITMPLHSHLIKLINTRLGNVNSTGFLRA